MIETRTERFEHTMSVQHTTMRALMLVALALLLTGVAVSICADEAHANGLTPNEALGKAIFFDEALSANGNQSCATCHAPEAGWTGPDSAVNAGGSVYEGSIAGSFGNRKPPSSAYATLSPIFYMDKKGTFIGGNFWDGRATGEKLGNPAADQAQGPFLNPLEQALPSAASVVGLVAASSYAGLFETVWGWDLAEADTPDEIGMAYDQIALSIAAYEASSESNAFTSKYDYYLAGVVDLNKDEKKGLNLFQGKGKCAKCHPSKPGSQGEPPLFTDFTFDNLGVPRNEANPFYWNAAYNPDGLDWADPGLGGFLVSRPEYETYADGTMGAHKVPTLRNVDLRPDGAFVKAYAHNGYFKSLEQIVHFYNTRDVPGEGWQGVPWPAPEVAENVNTAELGDLNLKPDEEAAIVAFLKTLSDGYQP